MHQFTPCLFVFFFLFSQKYKLKAIVPWITIATDPAGRVLWCTHRREVVSRAFN